MTPPKDLKLAFVAIFLAGTACIVAGKALFPEQPLVVTAVPLLLLGVYGYLVWRLPEMYRGGGDADNAYYLGFLFTIVSLSVALYQLDFKEDTGVSVDLVQNFGIALSTTILGLLLRTFLSPHHIDVGQQDEQARFQLYSATNDFVAALESNAVRINETFEVHTGRLAQSFIEAARIMTEQLPGETERATQALSVFGGDVVQALDRALTELKGLSASLAETASEMQDHLRTTIGREVSAVESSTAELRTVASASAKSLNTLEKSVRLLQARLESVNAPPGILEQQAERAYAVFAQSAGAAGTSMESAARSFEASLAACSQEVAQLSRQIQEIHQRASSELAQAVGKSLDAATQALETVVSHAADRMASASTNSLGLEDRVFAPPADESFPPALDPVQWPRSSA